MNCLLNIHIFEQDILEILKLHMFSNITVEFRRFRVTSLLYFLSSPLLYISVEVGKYLVVKII